jgi:hypothetical protein
VIVKEYIHETSADFDINRLQMMMKHRGILNRLQIYVTDPHMANYVNGILVDLSAAWVLPLAQAVGLKGYSIDHQLYHLQRCILSHHNKLEKGVQRSEIVKEKWDQFMKEKSG